MLLILALAAILAPGRDDAHAASIVADFTLQDPGPEASAFFGRGLAVGDVNGDGREDVIVGAYLSDVGDATGAGQAFVFLGGSPFDATPDFTLQNPTFGARGSFGITVATGDVDGDGRDDVIIGAPAADVGGATGAGEAFVFLGGSPFDSTPDFTLQDPSPATNTGFGFAIATGDATGDGRDEVIVGAASADVGATTRAGEAFVFLGSSPFDAIPDFTLQDPSPEMDALFGGSLASGDLNGDGWDDFIVGANNSDVDGLSDAGQAFVFLGGSPFDTTADFTLQEPSPQASARFSGRLTTGDLNGDGRDEMVATASGPLLDRALVFLGGSPFDHTADVTLLDPGLDFGAFFGGSLASGDTNGDGLDDLIVGAPFSNVQGAAAAGEAFVFLGGSPFDGTAALTLRDPSPADGAIFGAAVASGDVDGDGMDDVIVGANLSDVGAVHRAGEAFVFLGGPEGADADRDGCTDDEESGPNPFMGGGRNPKYFWDFYDTPDPGLTAGPPSHQRDRAVTISDIFRVAGRFGSTGTATSASDALLAAPASGYHAGYDRSSVVGKLAGPADGSITVADIFAVADQFGHTCS